MTSSAQIKYNGNDDDHESDESFQFSGVNSNADNAEPTPKKELRERKRVSDPRGLKKGKKRGNKKKGRPSKTIQRGPEKDKEEEKNEDEDDEEGDDEVYEVERILAHDWNDDGVLLYKVKWVGYGPESDTFEPVEMLCTAKQRIEEYIRSLPVETRKELENGEKKKKSGGRGRPSNIGNKSTGGHVPSEAGRNAPYTRLYPGYQEPLEAKMMDEDMANLFASAMFNEGMLRGNKGRSATRTVKRSQGEDRKRKGDREGGNDSKKFRMISSPSSSDSADVKPLAALAKPAILGAKVDEEEDKENAHKKYHPALKAKVVDLFAGMEASGNAKRGRRQKTYSDPTRISVVGWSNVRILSHYNAFSHCFINPLTRDEVATILDGGEIPERPERQFKEQKEKKRDKERDRERDRDRDRDREERREKKEHLYNGDGSPVRRNSIDSDAEEGDTVLPKKEKKREKIQAETRKREECGQQFSLADGSALTREEGKEECIQARTEEAIEAIEDHDSKVPPLIGDEETERIKMERVLKDLGHMRTDKVMVDVITPELMKNFRNPMEWNSLELQLFLDQFDVEQILKDFVAEKNFDGMNFFSLKVEEILNEFPTLPEEKEFNEKIYIFTVVDKIKKICNDVSMVFAPPPFNL